MGDTAYRNSAGYSAIHVYVKDRFVQDRFVKSS